MALVTAVVLSACSGSQRVSEPPGGEPRRIETERSYLRLPHRLLGAELEAEQSAPELIRCYEVEAGGGPDDLTYVQLELVLQGGRLQARIAQGRTSLAETFASCIESVTVRWDFDPELAGEGEILPLEFGPVEPEPLIDEP